MLIIEKSVKIILTYPVVSWLRAVELRKILRLSK